MDARRSDDNASGSAFQHHVTTLYDLPPTSYFSWRPRSAPPSSQPVRPADDEQLHAAVHRGRSGIHPHFLATWEQIKGSEGMKRRDRLLAMSPGTRQETTAKYNFDVIHIASSERVHGLDPLLPMLQSLWVGDVARPQDAPLSKQYRTVRKVETGHNPGPNRLLTVSQRQPYYVRGDEEAPPTNAWLQTTCNPFDGVLVIVARSTPTEILQQRGSQHDAPLQIGHTAFSESIIATWKACHNSSTQPRNDEATTWLFNG
ncbi:uncharacterized protein LTR77_010197 [Saxophila tyrrhenica]|uniref:Uncharacterized protein n=1 Tax=Saxophila tyrrhenica TaxID=1690608 RepID=A0AAV9NWE8_9PEZI|nr:hypothetical protein LTR77_010197 [Saxophila tyrrhenica]